MRQKKRFNEAPLTNERIRLFYQKLPVKGQFPFRFAGKVLLVGLIGPAEMIGALGIRGTSSARVKSRLVYSDDLGSCFG